MPTPPNPYEQAPQIIGREVGDRQRLLRHEAEDFLQSLIVDYGPRRAAHWDRGYSSQARSAPRTFHSRRRHRRSYCDSTR